MISRKEKMSMARFNEGGMHFVSYHQQNKEYWNPDCGSMSKIHRIDNSSRILHVGDVIKRCGQYYKVVTVSSGEARVIAYYGMRDGSTKMKAKTGGAAYV